MKSSLLCLLISQISIFAPSAWAEWSDIRSMEFVVEAYPVLGSEESKRDFEQMLKLQKSRKPEQCRQGSWQKWPKFSILFRSEMLDPIEMALVQPLMEDVASFTERVTTYHKGKFDRPRPFNTDARIKPCVEKPTGAKSYPSSHAAVASAVSCLLKEVFPAKVQDLEDYGKELGDLRAVIGVHHPSDVVAGQKLGHNICERLKSEPDFAEQLADLRKRAPEDIVVPE